MKIYIIGTGGVGGYFGGKLARAGNDVTFVSRGDFYNAMKKNGLTVNTVDDSFQVNPVQVIDSIDKITNPDLIIITVKTYDTEEVSNQLKDIVMDKTIVLTFQNGIDNDQKIKKIISKENIYPGLAYVISSKGGNGVINQTGGLKRLVFGDRSGHNSSQLKEIYELFKNSDIDTILSEDIEADLWKKFIFINAFSGFTAMCRVNIGEIRSDDCVYNLYKRCVKETIAVAEKLNINIPNTIFEDVVKITDNTAPDSKSSLLVDIENSRKNEIETLNGTLIRLAKDLKLDVPINETIYSAIKMIRISK